MAGYIRDSIHSHLASTRPRRSGVSFPISLPAEHVFIGREVLSHTRITITARSITLGAYEVLLGNKNVTALRIGELSPDGFATIALQTKNRPIAPTRIHDPNASKEVLRWIIIKIDIDAQKVFNNAFKKLCIEIPYLSSICDTKDWQSMVELSEQREKAVNRFSASKQKSKKNRNSAKPDVNLCDSRLDLSPLSLDDLTEKSVVKKRNSILSSEKRKTKKSKTTKIKKNSEPEGGGIFQTLKGFGNSMKNKISEAFSPSTPKNTDSEKTPKKSKTSSTSFTRRMLTRAEFNAQRLLEEKRVFAVYEGFQLTGREMHVLAEGEFLNDTVIDFYMKYVEKEKLDIRTRSKIHFFTSFFYTKFKNCEKEMKFASVSRWTRKIDLFDKEFVFIPICEHSHWKLAIICYPLHIGIPDVPDDQKPCILLLDSLGYATHRGSHVFRMIREYLRQEYCDKKGEIGAECFDKDHLKGICMRVPLQHNSCDCGVYLLHYIELFTMELPLGVTAETIHRLDWFSVEDITNKRFQIRRLIEMIANDTATARSIEASNGGEDKSAMSIGNDVDVFAEDIVDLS